MALFANMKLRSLQKQLKNLYAKKDSGSSVDVKVEAKTHLECAHFYDKHLYDKSFPFAADSAVEHYRAASIAGSADAQYAFAQRQIEKGKFWQHWAEQPYGHEIHKNSAKKCFEEAFYFLSQAENSGFQNAKRLHGLAYIHGWGLPQDKDAGIKLIAASIDADNAWDRVADITKELGLDQVEFMHSVMAIRNSKK